MAVKFFCDVCQKETDPKDMGELDSIQQRLVNGTLQPVPEKLLLCKECLKAIRDTIKKLKK